MRLSDLAKQIDAETLGDPNTEITSCATLEEAQSGQVSFLSNPRYVSHLATTKASAVVVAPDVTSDRIALLRTKDPYHGFCKAVVILHGFRKHPHQGIHPAAHVDPTATVGENTVIYPGCYIGPRTKIGRDCILYPNVVVYDDCILGDRVTLHAGTVIGQDGFGYATSQGVHHKIPQIGNVIVEDDVEMGANCAIDRATLGSTVIGKGTKFSDLVAIGHGVKVGPHCLFVAQVGIAGSCTVGHHVTMGGQVGVAGHLKIGNNVSVAGQSGIVSNIEDKQTLLGTPAMPIARGRRSFMLYTQLPEMVERIRALEQKIVRLGGDDKPTGKLE